MVLFFQPLRFPIPVLSRHGKLFLHRYRCLQDNQPLRFLLLLAMAAGISTCGRIKVGSFSHPPPPSSTTVKIEAESFTAMDGIGTENTSDAGGGLNVGWQDNNDWMDYP